MKFTYSVLTVAVVALCMPGLPARLSAQTLKQGQVQGDGQAFMPAVEGSQLLRDGSNIVVRLTIDLASCKVKASEAVLLTPMLLNGTDTLELPGIGLYGSQRWIQYTREYNRLSGDAETSFKDSKKPARYDYKHLVEYQPWMDGARLVLRRGSYGCCRKLNGEAATGLCRYHAPVVFAPAMAYMHPQAKGDKVREISGTAWVQFPVDRTEIYPDRYENPAELGKIRASIDSVRRDADITIKQVALKGYASPESPYKHNTELAKGRTASLRAYVQNMYRFPAGVITTSYEPEDWAGLRAKVAASGMDNREGLLALIDADIDPDLKEARIKAAYPEDYKFMLVEWYPALRHTDYRIEYVIREFTDTATVRRMVKEAPQKLSLNEFYLAAQGLDSRSVEFMEIWETAVRMYPNDPVANANAAATALQKGDTAAAERYLQKAGDSRETQFSRGALAVMQDRYDEAETCLKAAKSAGVKEADEALQLLERIRQHGRQK